MSKYWDTPFGPSEVICKESLQVPETCKENQDSFTSLEEAARNYTDSKSWAKGNYLTPYIRETFIAGAEWQKEQMMKEAVEGEITMDLKRFLHARTTSILDERYVKFGDKVKIIIVKEDE